MFVSLRKRAPIAIIAMARNSIHNKNLTNASFDVVGDPENLNLPEGEIEESALVESGVVRNWSLKTLPENLLFRYDNVSGIKRTLLLALEPPPEPPGKKDEKKK